MKMIFIFNIVVPLARAAEPSAPTSSDEVAEEIVVTATRSARRRTEAPVTTEVIDRRAIEASGAQDLAELLSMHPGLQVTRSFLGSTVQIHGLGAEHALVIVDGQRVAGRTGDAVDLSRFPIDAIERIEIVKGPGSALYGSDALAGVIHIVTRKAEHRLEARALGRGTHTGGSDLSLGLGHRGERWSTRLDAGHHRDPAFDLDPGDPATSGSATEQLQVDGRVDGRLATGMDLGLRGAWTRRQRDGVDLSEAGALFDRTNLSEEVRLAIEPRIVTDTRGTLSLLAAASLYRDQYLLDQHGGTGLDDYEDTRETVAQLQVQADRVHGRHHLTLGVDGLAEWIVTERIAGGRGDRRRAAAFAQDEIALDDRLAVMPSVRVDADTAFGTWPTGMLAARWHTSEALTLRGRVGTGYRAPSFRELYLRFENPSAGYRIDGNTELRPERSLHGSVAADLQLSEAFAITASGFWNELSDLIGYGTVDDGGPGGPVRYAYVNVDSARTRGGELGLRVDVDRVLDVQATLVLTDTLDRAREAPLEGRAALQGTLTATVRSVDDRTRATARANVLGPRPFYLSDGAGGETRLDTRPHALLDARLERRFGPVGLALGVENLLNAGHIDFLAIPPRRFWAGVDARLPAPRRGEHP